MSNIVQLDKDALYQTWRAYMLEHSICEHFGAFDDKSPAKFPYAVLTIVGMPTNTTDFQNYEHTVDLTVQSDCYIDSMKITQLFSMDEACWEFFNMLGMKKTGDSIPSSVGNSNVKRITSRYVMRNFAGKFLIDLQTQTENDQQGLSI